MARFYQGASLSQLRKRVRQSKAFLKVSYNYIFKAIYFLKTFYFVLGYNDVVIVSGEHQRDSGIPIQVSILPQTLLPSRLPDNIEQIIT